MSVDVTTMLPFSGANSSITRRVNRWETLRVSPAEVFGWGPHSQIPTGTGALWPRFPLLFFGGAGGALIVEEFRGMGVMRGYSVIGLRWKVLTPF
ncbi:hypothetical protein [Saccharopolyspora sp. NPDC003762]